MKCTACGSDGAEFHVTVSIQIFGPKSSHSKPVQFVLCPKCEFSTRQILCRDVYLVQRVAARLTQNPSWLSIFPEWQYRSKS